MLLFFSSCFHLFKQLGALISFQIIFRPQTVCEQNRELFSVPACLCCQLISFHRSLEQVRWLFVWWWKIIRAGKALCDLRLLIAIRRDGVLRDYAPSTPEKRPKTLNHREAFWTLIHTDTTFRKWCLSWIRLESLLIDTLLKGAS